MTGPEFVLDVPRQVEEGCEFPANVGCLVTLEDFGKFDGEWEVVGYVPVAHDLVRITMRRPKPRTYTIRKPLL